jgi:S-methylmethionine-dependent homocysteine/selenocysteine methylase
LTGVATITLLDGPMGTELESRLAGRGALPEGQWSAAALDSAADVVGAIHRDYAVAGAKVHTACTFRTTPRASGEHWRARMERAVALAREAAVATKDGPARVAGSIAPLEDCWRPDLAPLDDVARREHREVAAALASLSCDLLLCETFASAREAAIATEAAARTGVPTWTSLTAGYRADLMTPSAMRDAARACIDAGASAILVNCVPAPKTLAYVEAIAGLGVPFGAYANGGDVTDSEYVQYARTWVAAGATLIGGCCYTKPSAIRALADL